MQETLAITSNVRNCVEVNIMHSTGGTLSKRCIMARFVQQLKYVVYVCCNVQYVYTSYTYNSRLRFPFCKSFNIKPKGAASLLKAYSKVYNVSEYYGSFRYFPAMKQRRATTIRESKEKPCRTFFSTRSPLRVGDRGDFLPRLASSSCETIMSRSAVR